MYGGVKQQVSDDLQLRMWVHFSDRLSYMQHFSFVRSNIENMR